MKTLNQYLYEATNHAQGMAQDSEDPDGTYDAMEREINKSVADYFARGVDAQEFAYQMHGRVA